jgi:glycosyltransferase involved in cell wall biosynthesis
MLKLRDIGSIWCTIWWLRAAIHPALVRMPPLKIAVLVDRITPGATPKVLGQEVRHLRELGYDAEAVSIMDTGLPQGHHQFDEYLSAIPIRYISREHPYLRRLDFRIPPFSFFAAFDVAAGYTMARYFKRDQQRYDVIVAHASITCWIANKVSRSLGIPYVAVLWDPISYILDDVYRKKLPGPLVSLAMTVGRRVDRRLIDESLVAVTGSDSYADIVERYTGRRIEALYPGVDVPKTVPEARGDYLLTIDRWDMGNMPTWLLDVVAGLSRPVSFKVAGFWWPPKLEQEFLQRARELGIGDRVEVLGPVSEERLHELYRGARALIFPHKAPINFVVMEAAAQGCPTVMQAGMDLFTHGVDGFFPEATLMKGSKRLGDTHRPANIGEFIAYTERLISDERLAWEMGKKAHELMKGYSWRARAERLLGLIQTHLASARDT